MYFNQFCCISPGGMLTGLTSPDWTHFVLHDPAYCAEPDYASWISPMQLRRMSKPVRMGLTAAKICLTEEPLPVNSIHIGTAYGMLADTEVFLDQMIERNEQQLSPTAFIQSTHNTVSGQIAVALGCKVHNMTFVSGAHSFEHALTEALLMPLSETGLILLGAVDEITPSSQIILRRLGINDPSHPSGEGASFFCLSQTRQNASIARLIGLEAEMIGNSRSVADRFGAFLQRISVRPRPEDQLFIGDNSGYEGGRQALEAVAEKFFPVGVSKVFFKRYCGNYPTATGFAMGMALHRLAQTSPSGRCWIINGAGQQWSFICLEPV